TRAHETWPRSCDWTADHANRVSSPHRRLWPSASASVALAERSASKVGQPWLGSADHFLDHAKLLGDLALVGSSRSGLPVARSRTCPPCLTAKEDISIALRPDISIAVQHIFLAALTGTNPTRQRGIPSLTRRVSAAKSRTLRTVGF